MTGGRGGDPLLGASIGNYRIERLIGRGGMGRVYEARHPSIGAQVAVKVLAEDAAQEPDLIDRFFTEARAVNVIRHERIVNVLDLGQLQDGRPYIVMEHLAGAPLSKVAAENRPMPLGALARLMSEVLAGLAAAHQHGVVHRDLKPDNIFVTPAGHAKLLDFGIAKLAPHLDARSSVTRGSMLLGSPPYISPEHAAGLPTDARADLYSIGVIVYECSTGRRPFEAPALFEMLRQHVEDNPRPPRELRPDMPLAFEGVILRALTKAPEHRWQTAGEMAEALLAATGGMPPPAFAPLRIPAALPPAETSTSANTVAERPTARESGGPPTHARPMHHGPGSWPPPMGPAPPQQIAPPAPARGRRVALLAALGVLVTGAIVTAWALGRNSSAEGAADAGAVAAVVPPTTPPVTIDAGLGVNAKKAIPDAAPPPPLTIDAGATGGTIKTGTNKTGSDKTGTGKTGTGKTGTGTGAKPPPPGPDAGAEPVPAQNTEPVPTTMTIANPKRFDAGKFVSTATRLAKKTAKDAAVTMIRAPGLRMDGTVDLTTGVELEYHFTIPSKWDDPERWCLVVVTVKGDTANISPGRVDTCRSYKPYRPRCTFKQVLARAKDKGAPADGTCLINFLGNWGVRCGESFGEAFDDDC